MGAGPFRTDRLPCRRTGGILAHFPIDGAVYSALNIHTGCDPRMAWHN